MSGVRLPKGWELKIIDDIIGNDGLFCDGDWIESKNQDPNGKVRLIQLADIGDGYFKNKSSRFLTIEKAKELNCTFLEENDILISRMPDPLGRACLFPLKGKSQFITAVDVAIIRINNKSVNRKFIQYAINNPIIRTKIDSLQTGTTRKRISRKNLAQIGFPIPSIEIQNKITICLDEHLSVLNAGIESLKKTLDLLKVYRQSVLKYAFEGRLTNPNLKPGELPEGWKMVKTGDIMEKISNGYTPPATEMKDKGDIQFIKVYNLTFNGILNYSKNPVFISRNIHNKLLTRSITLPNDVLINIVGPPLGKVSIVPNTGKEWNINQAIVLFRPNENIISKYLMYYLQNPVVIQWLTKTSKATAGQYNIKVSTCREIPIPLIDVDIQQRIVSEIEERLSECEVMEREAKKALQQSESLRQSILKAAFEGKLVS